MGFGNFQHIPEWIVNQEIYTYLASKFDLENNVIKDDVANIEINAEIVERALGLPSCGNNERGDQSGEGEIEDEEVIKKWTQIEEELKSQRTMIVFGKKKLTKEQEKEIEETLKDSQGIPSFSLGLTQEFKSPTHSPERSMPEEILDIPPINEMIPANIPFQGFENPTNMGPTRDLTADEQKKIYNWVMNASKEYGVQEEMIASFQGYRILFFLRMEFRYLKASEMDKFQCKVSNY
ncbi:hypothetical protein PIB30_060285 [Stylosanthes scabra]|uniref:Uncharacterized protein n=1 Tax=Stylosanthes scabra TaxID=79078 RepID=A0ABU6UJK0_9FABA|nr:hypothetical protein [Stylosanthes scabra]